MRCKLVHLDASLVQWFRNVRRRRHKTETKGGQKGINPPRGRGPKFLSVIFELKVSLGLFRYLAAIKTTRLIMKRVMGLEFICLLNLFMSLFDCTETIGPTHPKPLPVPLPVPGENHSSANGNGRPFSNLVLFCDVLVLDSHCPLPSPAGNQRLSKQLNQQQPLQISSPEACPVRLSVPLVCLMEVCNFWY